MIVSETSYKFFMCQNARRNSYQISFSKLSKHQGNQNLTAWLVKALYNSCMHIDKSGLVQPRIT